MSTRSGDAAGEAAGAGPPGAVAGDCGGGCCARTLVQSTAAAIGSAARRNVMRFLLGMLTAQALLGRRGLRVLHDEEHLAGLDQAELLACQRFDRRRVGPEPAGFVAQPGILGAEPLDRRDELLMLLACPQRLGQ